jgi:5'-nucleotidase/UDP-sugar diphosphatase
MYTTRHRLLGRASLLCLVVLALMACRLAPTATPVPHWSTATVAPTQPAPTATLIPKTATPTAGAQRELIILHTNDEHGYLLPQESKDFYEGGAAYCAAQWLRQGYDPLAAEGHVLLLSGGDNWTGPAISTWFQGESAIEVMNAMGYRASAVGNHDFDAGQEVLRRRIAQAKFPYLAANLYRQGTQEVVDFVRPYCVIEVNGVRVGIIGLALRETPEVTALKYLEGLEFGDYEPALRRWAPVARQEGAEILIVLAHVPAQDLALLALKVQDLGISLFLGGHKHQARVTSAGDALVAAGSMGWRDYVWTRLVYDVAGHRVVASRQELVTVLALKSAGPPKVEPSITQTIEKWRTRAQAILGEVIGYTRSGLAQHSAALHNLLVDSWLWAYPQADIAMSNVGGFRAGLDSGEITVGEIVGVFPFENYLVELVVSGEQVLQLLERVGSDLVVGGLRRDPQGRIILLRDGSALDPKGTYRLLVTDFLYENAQYPFQSYDREPYQTSILWRQPVIDWLRAHRTTPDHPLEQQLFADQRP